MTVKRFLKAGLGMLLVAALAVPFMGGCGSSGMVITSGTLKLGSDTTYPPFESKEGNKAVGFDIDIADAIARELGLELEVISTAWEGIIPGLKTKKYDMIMSAMTITPERSKEINFSDPYIDSDQSIAVKKGSGIKTQADLKGKVVGVQIDTTGQYESEKMQKEGGLKEIQKFDTIIVAFQALEQGKVDAIVNDYPVNSYVSKTRGKTEVVAKIKTDEKYGIGIRRDNEELLKKVNEALAQIKKDGTYAEIYKKWFGVEPPK